MSKHKQLSVNVPLIISLMSVLLPILYLVGYFYERGNYEVFGIGDHFFTRTVQDYLVIAFSLILVGVSKATTYIANYYFIYLVILIIFLIFVYFTWERVVTILRSFIDKVIENKIVSSNYSNWKKFSVIFLVLGIAPYFILSTIFIALYLPFMSYNSGKKSAFNSIEQFIPCAENKQADDNCVYLKKDNKTILQGMFIAKGESSIAIWNGKSTVIYPLEDKVIVFINPPLLKNK